MASPTRRQLLQGALATGLTLPCLGPAGIGRAQPGAAASTNPPGNAGPANIAVNRLSQQLHVITAGGVNALAYRDADGIVLVDGGSAAVSAALLGVVAGIGNGAGVHTLFNTHWHPEQTGSNIALGDRGATIIAQENTRLWLTTDIVYPWDESQRFEPLPKSAQPNSSFYDGGELASGLRYGSLRHAAHTDGDLYVYFPDDNVLAVGDAVYGQGWPFVDWWTGGWIGGIVGGLELILSLMNNDTRVVPARGPVLGITDIQDQFRMYNTIYTRLQTMLNNGRGPDEAVAARPTEEFDAKRGPSDEFVRRSFESLWAYLSPDA